MNEKEICEGITDEQFNSFLEVLAKLVEATAKDGNDAARIIRDAKINSAE